MIYRLQNYTILLKLPSISNYFFCVLDIAKAEEMLENVLYLIKMSRKSRRVGKTYLVDQFFQSKYDFTYVGGHKLTQRIQLRNFAKALNMAKGQKSALKFNDWFDAFDSLEEYLESCRN